MMKKQKLAMGLFFLLGLSTLVFGSIVMYQTYDLDHLEGRTTIIGNIVDTNDDPIEGVIINCSDRETTSDENGFWELKGVPQGLIEVQFYKPGYVLYSLKWLAYPLEDLEDIEKSPNNISYSFKESGSSDIQLNKEMEEISIDDYANGTLSLMISADMVERINVFELYYSNNSVSFERIEITNGAAIVELQGDGTYYLGFTESGPFLNGFYPVNNDLNISNGLFSLWGYNRNMTDDLAEGTIQIFIDDNNIQGEREYTLIDNLTGSRIIMIEPIDQNDFFINVSPGIYDIEMTGETIRDRVFRGIIVNSSENKIITDSLVEGDVVEDLDLSLKGNYFIAAAYLGIALVLFYAALYMKKGGSWAVLLILAFVGFISQGFQIFTFNINSLIAVVLMVVLFSIRSEYNRKRQRKLELRSSRP